MLVLSRKREEKIVLQPGKEFEAACRNAGLTPKQTAYLSSLVRTELLIVDIRGDKVRIGLEAHRALDIDRREIAEKKYPQNGKYAGTRGKKA